VKKAILRKKLLGSLKQFFGSDLKDEEVADTALFKLIKNFKRKLYGLNTFTKVYSEFLTICCPLRSYYCLGSIKDSLKENNMYFQNL
jgi:hypothetical protein